MRKYQLLNSIHFYGHSSEFYLQTQVRITLLALKGLIISVKALSLFIMKIHKSLAIAVK